MTFLIWASKVSDGNHERKPLVHYIHLSEYKLVAAQKNQLRYFGYNVLCIHICFTLLWKEKNHQGSVGFYETTMDHSVLLDELIK